MQFNPMLSFNGQCEEAFKFYEKCFGGKIQTMMTWGGSPMAEHVQPELHDKIMHTAMVVGEEVLMGVDEAPDTYAKPKGVSITIQLNDTAEAERIFSALSEGGTVTAPLEKTFWAERFGMVTDRFGIPWMVNSGQAS